MKAIRLSFLQMLRQMRKDYMLFIMPLVPFLAGAAIRFGLPFAEERLTAHFSVPALLAPYYQLADALLTLLAPILLSFVAALILLEEADDGIVAYLSVTPLGKKGYLLSRLGMMALISIPFSLLVSFLFHIKGFGVMETLLLCIAGAIYGCVVSLIVVAFSSNKVEGMALGKLTSLLTVGLIIPYCVSSPAQYLFAPLPPFWLAKFLLEKNGLYLGAFLLVALGWAAALGRRFLRKLG